MMGFDINLKEKHIIVTFNEVYIKGDIMNSFILITENCDIKKLKYIIFDYTKVKEFPLPKDYIASLKTLTKFTVS
jgi:hypothetical protein